MTDFNRLAYWKKRIGDQILGLFTDTKNRLKEIRANSEHIGVDREEFDIALRMIGDGYDALKGSIDHIKEKK